ncbi:MAG: C40 family peptidase [Oscillospiraceae bacterium]|jgi:hypothetical protein|nr:C40 family peptidase [Oscillospiraceae bacterium]
MKRFGCLLIVVAVLCAALPASAEGAATASGLIAFAEDQVGNAYIYGAYGQISTDWFRRARAELYPDAAKLIFRWGAAWDGLPAYDCIGLFKAYAISAGMRDLDVKDINTTRAWYEWTSEKGLLEGSTLQPGMALFRVEGTRTLVRHMGIYIGDGRVIHARGTRWGVAEDMLPGVFTHWATLNWMEYDLPMEQTPAVQGVFLPEGSRAVVESDDAERVIVSEIPHEAGKLRLVKGYFDDGTPLTVLAVPDEISRQVRGTDIHGNELIGYVRLTELREAE